MLEEPVRIIEEPKEYFGNLSEEILIRLPQLYTFEVTEAVTMRKPQYLPIIEAYKPH